MDSEVKKEVKYLPVLLTVLIMLLVAGGATAGVWYYAGQQAKKVADDNAKQVAALQKQIDDLNKKSTSTASPKVATTVPTTTTPSVTSAVLTNDQIFQEVATKFGFTRSQVSYFRIWGQDKVQYSLLGNSSGTSFAYKAGSTWVSLKGGQAVNDCAIYENVPEKYLPICSKGTSPTLYYENSDGTSLNYPISTAVHYIGQ